MASYAENLAAFKTFYSGYQTYLKTGETPHEAYVAMRKLFVESNGWFNDIFQLFYGLKNPGLPGPAAAGSVFTGISESHIKQAVEALDKDGCHVFPQRLPQAYIDELTEFALKTPAVLQYDRKNPNGKQPPSMHEAGQTAAEDGDYFKLGHLVRNNDILFDADNLVATNYRFPEEAVLSCPAVQSIMADPVIVSVAKQYIRSQVMFSIAGMWWTTTFGCNEPSSALAQQFHFDMDRLKFITFFLYLTDVGPGDGPHCHVRGTFKRKPKELRRDGRFTDAEIEAVYDKERILEFTAPKGTLLITDGRGFHKAKMPTTGNRLVLEFELCSSMFGVAYPKSSFEIKSPALEKVYKNDPILWDHYNVIRKSAATRKKVLV